MNLENKTLKTYGYALILGFSAVFGAIIIYFLIISPLYASTKKAGEEFPSWTDQRRIGLCGDRSEVVGEVFINSLAPLGCQSLQRLFP